MSPVSAEATVLVNGRPMPLGPGQSLAGLLEQLGLSGRKGVAVAVNGGVIPRTAWAGTALAASDQVLVIQATQGG